MSMRNPTIATLHATVMQSEKIDVMWIGTHAISYSGHFESTKIMRLGELMTILISMIVRGVRAHVSVYGVA